MNDRPFQMDLEKIRERARKHMEKGAITDGYKLDLDTVHRVLNEALATELVCILRYKHHYYTATGIKAKTAAQEFLEHANQEQDHADRIAARIVQLGGEPNFNPEGLMTRSHADYSKGKSLKAMLEEDLFAERIAIESYREMVEYFGQKDSTTRTMLEFILSQEEEHADDLMDLLTNLKDD